MKIRSRIYTEVFREHLKMHRQMVFVTGPRQVGKTTLCRSLSTVYFNWDNLSDREAILAGPEEVAQRAKLYKLKRASHVVMFDEIHKFSKWKQFLKGFFDVYSDVAKIIVTGSSRMDIYRRGGDSLMGRYFSYRMHPFSVREAVDPGSMPSKRLFQKQVKISDREFNALWRYGGYPEPFLKRDKRFSLRWLSLRMDQLVREEIRDLSQIQQLDEMEILARILYESSASQLVYANLSKKLRTSIDTVRRWVKVLCDLHVGFLIRPWFKNVSRSLRKEPKWYLRDWSSIEDVGARAETFVACHLLKAVDAWNDMGFGRFELGYLRDKQKREVDFIVVSDQKPLFLVEVKYSDQGMSDSLEYFQKLLKVPYAFQVVINSGFEDVNCFSKSGRPVLVPAKTFLSQLF